MYHKYIYMYVIQFGTGNENFALDSSARGGNYRNNNAAVYVPIVPAAGRTQRLRYFPIVFRVCDSHRFDFDFVYDTTQKIIVYYSCDLLICMR